MNNKSEQVVNKWWKGSENSTERAKFRQREMILEMIIMYGFSFRPSKRNEMCT